MTESGPRKGLWDLMGRKKADEVSPSQPQPEKPAGRSEMPASDSSSKAADSDLADNASANPVQAASPLELNETPSVAPRGRSLWSVMQHGATQGDVAENDAGTQPKKIDRRLHQMAAHQANPEAEPVEPESAASDTSARKVDRRLRQIEPPAPEPSEPEVQFDDELSVTPRKKFDRRLAQLAPEVEIVPDDELQADRERSGKEIDLSRDVIVDDDEIIVDDDPVDREQLDHSGKPRERKVAAQIAVAIPAPPLPKEITTTRSGLSRSALWSLILGLVSLPVSLIAIYPAFWSRIPPSLVGFGGLLSGFLAVQEIQRSKNKMRGTSLAYVGMATGLLGMFAGPAVYSPLDLYGQWCNSYTGGHLRQLGLAVDAYVQQQKTYPAGGVFHTAPDRKGEPEAMHGWMTLILPHLPEGAAIFKQIDMNKPWSDPANQLPFSQVVPPFTAAGGDMSHINGKFAPAHFSGVGGLITLPDGSIAHAGVFDNNSDTTREDVIDGLSNTLIAGEISINYPAWGDPRNWRRIGKGLNRDPEGFGNSRHTGAMFLMGDGSVRFLPNNTDPKVLQMLSTRDGEEK